MLEQIQHEWTGGDGRAQCLSFEYSLGYRNSTKLDHPQMTLAVCALLAEKFGPVIWTIKARVFNWGASMIGHSNPIQTAHNMMSEIMGDDVSVEIGVAILRSVCHTMGSMHTLREFAAMDGIDCGSELKNLSETSLTQFNNLGFPNQDIQYLRPWKQRDDMSCCYHNLHFIHHVLFIADNFDFSTYEQPNEADWSNTCISMAQVVDLLCERHFSYVGLPAQMPSQKVSTGPGLGRCSRLNDFKLLAPVEFLNNPFQSIASPCKPHPSPSSSPKPDDEIQF